MEPSTAIQPDRPACSLIRAFECSIDTDVDASRPQITGRMKPATFCTKSECCALCGKHAESDDAARPDADQKGESREDDS